MTSDDALTLAAAQVARAAPRSWEDLMKALSDYSTTQRENLVSSTLEQLVRAQGRAQIAREIHDLFATCIQKAEQIEKRRTR